MTLSPSMSPARWAALGLAMLQTACHGAGAGDAPTPIRVVRVGHANVDAYKENIRASVEGCRSFKKLPPQAAALPADAVLKQLAVIEEEELFDGQMWAKYETQRTIGADASSGCKLTLFTHRAAEVSKLCVSRTVGSNPSMVDLTSLTDPVANAIEIQEEKLMSDDPDCQGSPKPEDVTGLPTESAGAAQCIWASAIMARSLAKLSAKLNVPASANDGKGPDFCYYAKRPTYYYKKVGKPVMLESRIDNTSLSGADISSIIGEVAATSLSLKDFSDGAPIDASRFTRGSVEAFLKQPAKAAVGVQ